MNPRQLPAGEFEWTVTLGKAIRDALLVSVPVAGSVFLLALGGVLEQDKLAEIGVPFWAIPVIAGAFAGLRNLLRIRFGWPVVVALCLFASPAQAQLPEPIEGLVNPLVVMGPQYLNTAPPEGSSRVRFFITANVAGVKPVPDLPIYLGGIGIDIRTLPGFEEFGEADGAGLSLPIITYAFNGDQVVLQAGYSFAFGASEANGWYGGVGFSFTSPNEIAAKREAKAKKKAAALLLSHPTASQ